MNVLNHEVTAGLIVRQCRGSDSLKLGVAFTFKDVFYF
jgi:hypothetical protein